MPFLADRLEEIRYKNQSFQLHKGEVIDRDFASTHKQNSFITKKTVQQVFIIHT